MFSEGNSFDEGEGGGGGGGGGEDVEDLVDRYVDLERYGMLVKIVWKDQPDSITRRKIKELLLNQSKGYILIYFTLSGYNQTISTVCPLLTDINFAAFKMGIIEYFDCFAGALCVWQNDRNVSIQCDSLSLKLMFFPYHHKILTQGKVQDQKVFIHAYCRTINKIKPNTYELNDFRGSLVDQMLQITSENHDDDTTVDHSISMDSLKSCEIEHLSPITTFKTECQNSSRSFEMDRVSPDYSHPDLGSTVDSAGGSWEIVDKGEGDDGEGWGSRPCSRQDLVQLRTTVNNDLSSLKEQMSFLIEKLSCLPGFHGDGDEEGSTHQCLKGKLKKYQSIEEQGGLSYKEQEDIVAENVKLRKENVELRLSLQKRQQKLDDLVKDSMHQKLQYEEQNGHVQGIVQSLQTDLKEKRIALTKTSANHQETLSDSLKCQKELKQFKERYNDDFQRSLSSLGREIGLCVDDVKSFLNLCISRIKGDEPSLDSLLGLGLDPIDRPDYPAPTLDLDYVKSQLKEMSELRKDVDELRHLVSEHYAQEIGDNMCITQ